MSNGGGFAPPVGNPPPRYVRCARCQVPQPMPWSGPARCVACGAPFHRWIAHSPPGSPARSKPRTRPPAAVLRTAVLPRPASAVGVPAGRLARPPGRRSAAGGAGIRRRRCDAAGWLSLATAVLALLAAGAEIWRFSLMLEGRTRVLSGPTVRTSDILVAAAGLAVVLAGLATVADRCCRAGPGASGGGRQARAGRRRVGPSRSPPGCWCRSGTSTAQGRSSPRSIGCRPARKPTTGISPPGRRRLTLLWWLSWVASSVLMIADADPRRRRQPAGDRRHRRIAHRPRPGGRGGGRSRVRAAAAVRATFTGRRAEYDGWVVQQPRPTRQVDGDLTPISN